MEQGLSGLSQSGATGLHPHPSVGWNAPAVVSNDGPSSLQNVLDTAPRSASQVTLGREENQFASIDANLAPPSGIARERSRSREQHKRPPVDDSGRGIAVSSTSAPRQPFPSKNKKPFPSKTEQANYHGLQVALNALPKEPLQALPRPPGPSAQPMASVSTPVVVSSLPPGPATHMAPVNAPIVVSSLPPGPPAQSIAPVNTPMVESSLQVSQVAVQPPRPVDPPKPPEQQHKQQQHLQLQHQARTTDDGEQRVVLGATGAFYAKGFRTMRLNGIYTMNPQVTVNHHPTYWDHKGRIFLYYQTHEKRWALCPRSQDGKDFLKDGIKSSIAHELGSSGTWLEYFQETWVPVDLSLRAQRSLAAVPNICPVSAQAPSQKAGPYSSNNGYQARRSIIARRELLEQGLNGGSLVKVWSDKLHVNSKDGTESNFQHTLESQPLAEEVLLFREGDTVQVAIRFQDAQLGQRAEAITSSMFPGCRPELCSVNESAYDMLFDRCENYMCEARSAANGGPVARLPRFAAARSDLVAKQETKGVAASPGSLVRNDSAAKLEAKHVIAPPFENPVRADSGAKSEAKSVASPPPVANPAKDEVKAKPDVGSVPIAPQEHPAAKDEATAKPETGSVPVIPRPAAKEESTAKLETGSDVVAPVEPAKDESTTKPQLQSDDPPEDPGGDNSSDCSVASSRKGKKKGKAGKKAKKEKKIKNGKKSGKESRKDR